MGSNDFQGTRAKLDRAEQHLDELRAQLKIGWEKHLYGISTYDDLGSHETIVTLLKPKSIFSSYSVIAGEIVHQTRSALEHVIWQMLPNPNKSSGFPVFTLEHKDPANPKKGYYEGQGLKMIEDINPAAQTLIRSVQPFATGTDHRLNLLHEMWNWDKHRLLNMMVIYPQAISPFYRYLSDNHISILPTIAVPEIDDGAEIARVPHPHDFVPGKVQMEAEVGIAIRFADAGPAVGESPEEFLANLLKLTRDIVGRLIKTI